MATAPPPAVTRTRPGDEEFLALLCADEQLLRAEFDEIVAAQWPNPPAQPPAQRPRPDRGGDAPGNTRAGAAGADGPSADPRQSRIDAWSRQRCLRPRRPEPRNDER